MTNGDIVKKTVLFMANRWDEKTAKEIFGELMGEHFWTKWVCACERNDDPDYATMKLFYEMTTDNLDKLATYAAGCEL